MINLILAVSDITTSPANAPHFPYSATIALIVGFISAATIGSIAWYNSKRPPGWEDKERPDIVPKVDKSDFIANTDK